MADPNNIPLEFRQQFALEQALQTPGIVTGSGAIDSGGDVIPGITYDQTSNISGQTTTVSPSPPQKVVNQCKMIATDFASSYIGSSNPDRNYLLIQNKGSGVMYVILSGQQSSSGTGGIKIPVGGSWEPIVVPVNSFTVNGAGVVVEGIAT